MIKKINKDELYPYYFLGEGNGEDVDIPEEKLAWIESVFVEFHKVQIFLKKLCEPPITAEDILKRKQQERIAREAKLLEEAKTNQLRDSVKLINQRALDAAWERHIKKKGIT
jgi:hypothetical protein